jgi:hypothetical protein
MPNIQIQTRRDTAAVWLSTNAVLASGELAFETDTNKFKFGNGTSNWTVLPYAGGGTTGGVRHITLSTVDTILPSDQLVLVSTTATASNPTLYLSTSFQNGQRLDIRYVAGVQNINILPSDNANITTTGKYPIITMKCPDESAGVRGYENLVYANGSWYSQGGDSIKYVPPPAVELDFANSYGYANLSSITVAWQPVPGAQSYKVFYSEGEKTRTGPTVRSIPVPPAANNPSDLVQASKTVPLFTGQSNATTALSITLRGPTVSTMRFSAVVYAYTDLAGTVRLTNYPPTSLSVMKAVPDVIGNLYLNKTYYSYKVNDTFTEYITENRSLAPSDPAYDRGNITINSKPLIA